MSDADWNDAGAQGAPAQKRIPRWVWWGCGGGCLVMTLIGITLAIFLGRIVRDAIDPEKAWQAVGELLPHDQRPEGWQAFGTSVMGRGFYTLTPPQHGVLLLVQRFEDGRELESLLEPDSPANGGFLVLDRLLEPELGTLEIQGRATRCLRFRGGLPEQLGREAHGQGIRIDLTGQGVPTLLQISAVQAPSTRAGEEDGDESLSAELVNELLKPFDVWRGR